MALCAEVCTSLIRTLSHVRTGNFSDYPKTSQLLSQLELVEAVSVTRLGRSFIHVGTCALNRNIEGYERFVWDCARAHCSSDDRPPPIRQRSR